MVIAVMVDGFEKNLPAEVLLNNNIAVKQIAHKILVSTVKYDR